MFVCNRRFSLVLLKKNRKLQIISSLSQNIGQWEECVLHIKRGRVIISRSLSVCNRQSLRFLLIILQFHLLVKALGRGFTQNKGEGYGRRVPVFKHKKGRIIPTHDSTLNFIFAPEYKRWKRLIQQNDTFTIQHVQYRIFICLTVPFSILFLIFTWISRAVRRLCMCESV